ncbi:hypothetical protein AK812_SmicGene18087, partial [Symbiodinium microadriaticum]
MKGAHQNVDVWGQARDLTVNVLPSTGAAIFCKRAPEDAELLKRARDMALRLTKLPHQAVRLVRDAVDSGSTNSLPAQLEVERLAQAKCLGANMWDFT